MACLTSIYTPWPSYILHQKTLWKVCKSFLVSVNPSCVKPVHVSLIVLAMPTQRHYLKTCIFVDYSVIFVHPWFSQRNCRKLQKPNRFEWFSIRILSLWVQNNIKTLLHFPGNTNLVFTSKFQRRFYFFPKHKLFFSKKRTKPWKADKFYWLDFKEIQ